MRSEGAVATIVRTLTLAAAATLVATAAFAHSHKVKKLEIVHPWCFETNDAGGAVPVFMTIKNADGKPDKLLRVSTAMAGKAELRAAGAAGGTLSSVVVTGRGAVNLKRDGPHVLLSGVKNALSRYDSFMLTLVFERAGKVEVEVMVEEASILDPPKH